MYECHAKYVYFKMIKCISFTSMRAKRISGGGDASSYNRNTSIKARKWSVPTKCKSKIGHVQVDENGGQLLK